MAIAALPVNSQQLSQAAGAPIIVNLLFWDTGSFLTFLIIGLLVFVWFAYRLRVALVPVLEASVETMTPQAMAKAIELNADFEGSAASVIGDPVRLQQVFTNLLSNAIKFTPQGGRVDVWFVSDGNNVEINLFRLFPSVP
jgi:signal transduction histidine kinase